MGELLGRKGVSKASPVFSLGVGSACSPEMGLQALLNGEAACACTAGRAGAGLLVCIGPLVLQDLHFDLCCAPWSPVGSRAGQRLPHAYCVPCLL